MKNRKTIFLDLDGVIVDLFERLEEVFNLQKGSLARKPYPCLPDSIDISEKIGMTQIDFWSKFNNIKFWENLPKFPWADDLVIACFSNNSIKDCYILTAPSKIAYASASGKFGWLKKHYPYFSDNGKVIITNKKHMIAGKDRILVDDTIEKIEKFVEYGGTGILFPQIYNKNYDTKNKNILRPKDVKQTIEMIKGL